MLLSLIALFYFLFGLILQIFNGQKCQQWSFGYGSNMDVTHMRLRKELNVYDYKPGILKNYQMLFNLKSSSINRPATGGLIYNFQHETHGLLFCLDLQSMEKLHRWERGYTRKLVSIEGYDGKVTDNVLVYTTPENRTDRMKSYPTSRRYLNIILRGAKNIGLDRAYIEKLKAASIYKPTSTLIWELKNNGEYPENLREITVKELAKHNSVNDTWVSIAGYVINASTNPISKWFKIHRGRDITSRALMHFHDIPLDKNDDRGKPPYPLLSELDSDEVDHLSISMDMYHIRKNLTLYPIVGYLKEFHDQQKSGVTEFLLPPRT